MKMQQNREEWLTHQMVALPFRRASTGWRRGQRGSSWRLAEVRKEGERLRAHCLESGFAKKDLGMGQVDHKPVHFWGTKHPGLLKNMARRVREGILLRQSASRDHVRSTVCSAGLSSTGKDGHARVSAVKGHRNDSGMGAPII